MKAVACADPSPGWRTRTLFIDVAPGEYATTSEVTLQVVDNYDRYVGGTEVTHALETISLSSASGWQVKSGDLWVDATDSPTTPNSSPSPKHYRRITEWDSTKKPNGCNWEHTVRTVDSGGDPTRIWFTDGLSDARPHGPKPLSANVTNLFISGVSCNNGTIDYFKWDPEGDAPLNAPTIEFDIVDGEPSPTGYEWIVWFRQTSGADEPWTNGEFWSVSGSVGVGASTEVTVPLAAALVAAGQSWGTYTFDICVQEKRGGQLHDRYALKDPYCQWVSWHEVETGPDGVRVSYTLTNQSLLDAQTLEVVTIDSRLAERAPQSVPRTHSVVHDGDGDGILVYEFGEDEPAGLWRVVWIGLMRAGGCREQPTSSGTRGRVSGRRPCQCPGRGRHAGAQSGLCPAGARTQTGLPLRGRGSRHGK